MSVFDIHDGWEGLLNHLFGARTTVKEVRNERVTQAIERAIDLVENEFCRADRDGYKDWAESISKEISNGPWRLCDAWFEGVNDEN